MITCITVSVNYHDILDIILPQNAKFFKTWYIVTQETDTKTLEVITKHNYDNVKVLYFDFYKNAVFNKGGGIKYAQTFIKHGEKVLIMDSDIYLPDTFNGVVNYPIKENILYSCKRYDYHTYENFMNNIHDHIYHYDYMGFFQLYIYDSKYQYADSDSCRTCDANFTDIFPIKVLFGGIFIKHLGKDNQNHFGRTTINNFAES